jgi:hypothetical protein
MPPSPPFLHAHLKMFSQGKNKQTNFFLSSFTPLHTKLMKNTAICGAVHRTLMFMHAPTNDALGCLGVSVASRAGVSLSFSVPGVRLFLCCQRPQTIHVASHARLTSPKGPSTSSLTWTFDTATSNHLQSHTHEYQPCQSSATSRRHSHPTWV